MMLIDEADMNKIITSAKFFIKVYIEKDLNQENLDGISQSSLGSINSEAIESQLFPPQGKSSMVSVNDLSKSKTQMGKKNPLESNAPTVQLKYEGMPRQDTETGPLLTQINDIAQDQGNSPKAIPMVEDAASKLIKNEKSEVKNDKSKRQDKPFDINESIHESEEEDEEFENSFLNKETREKMAKLEKFNNLSKPKTIPMMIKIGAGILIFIVISLADYLVNLMDQNNLKWLLKNQLSLIITQGAMNSAYAAIYEGVASGRSNYTVDGVYSLDYNLRGVNNHKSILVEYLEGGYPTEYSGFKSTSENIIFGSVCANYLKKEMNSKYCKKIINADIFS